MNSITLLLLLTLTNISNSFSSGVIEVDFYKKYSPNSFPLAHNFLVSDIKIFQESFPLLNSPNDEMIINLCLGTPPQCFDVLVDSGSYYLWIRDFHSTHTTNSGHKFDYKNSSTFKNLNITHKMQYGTGSAEGDISTDVLTLGEKTIDILKFILVEKDESNDGIDGILGLGYYYNALSEKNPLEFSLIDQLYNNNQINSKIYTQKYTEHKKGKMYIGDLPDEIKLDIHNYGTCPTIKFVNLDELNTKWECELKRFFFGNINLYNTSEVQSSPVLFDTGTNIVLIPIEFFIQLKVSYFNQLIDEGLCSVNKDGGRFYTFVCSYLAPVLKLPDVNFGFGDWIIKMKPIELFTLSEDRKLHFIMIAASDMDMWIFGEPILKKYHMVFDKTNDLIGFYGTKDLYRYDQEFPNNDQDILIVVIILVSVLAVIALVSLALWFKNRKKKTQFYNPYLNFNLLKNSDM